MSTDLDNKPNPSSATESTSGRRFHWLVRLLFAVVAVHLMLAPALVFALILADVPLDLETPLGYLVMQLPSLAIMLGAIGLVWVLMRYVDRRPLRESGLSFDARSIPLLIGGTALMTAISLAGSYGLAALGTNYAPEVTVFDQPWMIIGDLIIRSLLHAAFCEELIFRGYLMQTLPFRSPWLVAAISAVAFGVLHLNSQGSSASPILYAFNAVGFAFLAAAVALATRSIWPAIGVHFGVYIAETVMMFTGVGAGPLTWLVVGFAAILVGAAILAWHSRRRPVVPDPLYAPSL